MNKKDSIILVEGMYSDTGVIAFILSIAIKLSNVNQKIVCVQTPGNAKISNFTYNKSIVIFKYRIFILTFFKQILDSILILFLLVNNDFDKIGNYFKHDKIDCSNEFYDTLSIKKGIFWRKLNKVKLYFLIIYEFLFFKFVSNLFIKYSDRIDLVIIGDTAYRYGYFAKISSLYKIPIICNLDLNSIFFNYYPNGYEFKISRPILIKEFDNLTAKYPNYNSQIIEYFENRFSGNIMQHDVLNAYKKQSNKNILDDIPNDKIIVSVFAHVFSDAPHNIPGLLFDDFYSWFIETISALTKNENVFILIKEHPSSGLYNVENGLVSRIVSDNFSGINNLKVISDFSPSIIMGISDFVVTASGTIIYECLYKQINLIIASKTSFSSLEILNEFNSQYDYLEFLLKLSISDKKYFTSEHSNLVSFYHFYIYNNRDLYPDFPLKPYVRGNSFNIDSNQFEYLLEYMSGNSDFSLDFNNTILSNYENFIPKLNSIEKI